MNTQEREQLTQFLQQLGQARLGAKDVDAEILIRETCSTQPDANYLLVQRCLLLDQALEKAQSEISRLHELQQPPNIGGSGFLNSNAWGNTPSRTQQTPRIEAFSPTQQPSSTQNLTPGWGSGMLGTVATTAAGVVAGSFLYQGINNLIGHHGDSAVPLADKMSAPTIHSASDPLLSTHSPEDSLPPIDFDALGPSDDDLGWT